MQKAAKGQAIIWFEDRTMARVHLTHCPMPSKGVPANKRPAILDVVTPGIDTTISYQRLCQKL